MDPFAETAASLVPVPMRARRMSRRGGRLRIVRRDFFAAFRGAVRVALRPDSGGIRP